MTDLSVHNEYCMCYFDKCCTHIILEKTPERREGHSDMVTGSRASNSWQRCSDSYSYISMKEQCGHWATKHEIAWRRGLLLGEEVLIVNVNELIFHDADVTLTSLNTD